MTEEKWQEIIGTIKDKFELISHETQDLPSEQGKGQVETVEFYGPLGKMKLEFTTQPLVIDKKTIGSRRIGSETKVQYIYSDTEKVRRFKAYRWNQDDDNWIEMEAERGAFEF
ncbi:hypothetical protein C4569_03725 [Candidatus Parcubacteria bacterium]|nr:MAG: hypothetical protein C4569_03725 [Candidatus Parcubacteria bacterium]